MNVGGELEKKPNDIFSTILSGVRNWWNGDNRRASIPAAYKLAREHRINPFSAAVMAVDCLSREAIKAMQIQISQR